MRLNRYISLSGVTSRRKADELIRSGKVMVNGKKVTKLGTDVNPSLDRIAIDGEELHGPGKARYYMMNKPTGYLTTVSDPNNRPTVMALLPDLDDFIKPVGRLDVNTEGLLLFTNDGEMAYRLTHPKYKVPKRYTAAIEGKVTRQGLTPLIRGIKLYDGTFKFSELTVLKQGRQQTMVEAVIHEGKKRLVRRMFAKVGYPVKFLLRNGIGPLQLGHLPKGACRPLRKGELMALRKAVQLEEKDEY